MRIVWFGGRPFPVSSHPRGLDDPGTQWHVQTPDGEWHAIAQRPPGDNGSSAAWSEIMAAAQAWLTEHYCNSESGTNDPPLPGGERDDR